jgi:hypothetical protein
MVGAGRWRKILDSLATSCSVEVVPRLVSSLLYALTALYVPERSLNDKASPRLP